MKNTLDQPLYTRSLAAVMYAPAPVTNKGLCKAFTTALLLTGNVKLAENAVLDAIRSTEAEEMSDDQLFLEAVVAAVSPERGANAQIDEFDRMSSRLPLELRRILRLSVDQRQCFVARILLGWSGEDCSLLLRMNVRRVDESACAAARELARIGEEEKAA